MENIKKKIHLRFRYVGGFVRKVDDVIAYLAAQPSRLRAHHRNKLSLRVYCCCCTCILHLQQYRRRLNLLRWCARRRDGCAARYAVTSSTFLTNPQHNETIDVFYIKKPSCTVPDGRKLKNN